jgi:hypothetical protein
MRNAVVKGFVHHLAINVGFSRRPKRVGVSLHSLEYGNTSSFINSGSSSHLEYRPMGKVLKSIDSGYYLYSDLLGNVIGMICPPPKDYICNV